MSFLSFSFTKNKVFSGSISKFFPATPPSSHTTHGVQRKPPLVPPLGKNSLLITKSLSLLVSCLPFYPVPAYTDVILILLYTQSLYSTAQCPYTLILAILILLYRETISLPEYCIIEF